VPAPRPGEPSAGQLVELAHRAVAALDGPHLVHLRLDREAEALDLGLGPIPGVGHPADALVGFRAPDDWDGVGLASAGTLHHGRGPEPQRSRGRFTTLALRDRPGATLVERDDGGTELLEGDPVGWVVDVLRRVLGLPTAPPEGSTALLIDVWWLDAMVRELLDHPGRHHGWRWMARAHPLCPPATVPEPEELQARASAEALARPWSRLRGVLAGRELPAGSIGLPVGRVLSGEEWFDDGALSRWVLRGTLPPDVLLGELVERLPAHLVDRLVAGLAEVDLDALAA
jgi:hypothetical protein